MVTISFKTGNAVFRNEDESLNYEEVALTIKAVADIIATGLDEGKIRDFNGNTVGEFKVDD